MKIIDYTIVGGATPTETVEIVIELISGGWQPIGGISATNSEAEDKIYYAQAMVKYEDEGLVVQLSPSTNTALRA